MAAYRPNKQTKEAQNSVYKNIDFMMETKDQPYPEFTSDDGDRTLQQFIDDSDRRLNGYTLTREEQGKEDWQANVFNQVTRRKLKAIVAGVALQVPTIHYTAVNPQGTVFSAKRAELIKQLVRHSRLTTNPSLEIFFEAWEAAGKGTVIKYDGYLKTKYKRKCIKSYDLESGEVEFDEREETVDDRPIELQVPIEEFFIWDFYIENIQDQPRTAWIQHYNSNQVEQEFGQYPNYKYVKDKKTCNRFATSRDGHFYDSWHSRVKDEDDFEVIRYYDKEEDRYEIWVNGVDILRAPLLWGKKRKLYPFAKTIFEPFVNRRFFWGKSFPSIIEGIQDVDNTLLNTTLDKLYRSLVPPMLVGLENKDLLDIEEELVNQDNKIYVPNIDQVKPMPFEGVNQGDLAMMQYVARLEDLDSVDANQQGLTGRGVTAREVLVANENAQRLKSVFFTFLEDLWIQKTRLRIINVMMNYTKPKTTRIIGKKGQEELQNAFQTFNVPDTEFSDGSTGILGVQIVPKKKDLPLPYEIDAKEDAMKEQGINYKLVAATSSYLDEWDIDFVVVGDSLHNQERSRKETEMKNRHQYIATLFPRYWMANEDKFFRETVELEGDVIDEYQPPVEQPTAPQEGQQTPQLFPQQ